MTFLKDLKCFSFHICHLGVPRVTQDIRHHLTREGLRLSSIRSRPEVTQPAEEQQGRDARSYAPAGLPGRASHGHMLPENLKLHFIKHIL